MEFIPEESPFLRMLVGNLVTAGSLWILLNLRDTNALRRVHPLLTASLSPVPMHWVEPVNICASNASQLAACYPQATFKMQIKLDAMDAAPDLPLGVIHLELCRDGVTNAVIHALPKRLKTLKVSGCQKIKGSVSFAHLTSLEELDCSKTAIGHATLVTMPTSIKKLIMNRCRTWDGAFTHLVNLKELECQSTIVNVSSLPVSLQKLNLAKCQGLYTVVFTHLVNLKELNCIDTDITEVAISTMPHSLQKLRIENCNLWMPQFEHITSLEELYCSETNITDITIATLPISIQRLDVSACESLTETVSFNHLTNLLELRCNYIDLRDVTVMPPSLQKLHVANCGLQAITSFAHLTSLIELDCSINYIGDNTIATLPISLKMLNVNRCENLTQAVSFNHLTNLTDLQCNSTNVSDTTIATLPAGLQYLDVGKCNRLTSSLSFSHLQLKGLVWGGPPSEN